MSKKIDWWTQGRENSLGKVFDIFLRFSLLIYNCPIVFPMFNSEKISCKVSSIFPPDCRQRVVGRYTDKSGTGGYKQNKVLKCQ